MSPEAEKLLRDALNLPAPARAALAGSLIESLDATVDADAESAWSVEIERRVAELDAGTVKTVPWAEVRRNLLMKFKGADQG